MPNNDVGNGEHYEQFYYRVPRPADSVATHYGSDLDNVTVLHHWLLFSTSELDAEGTHKTSPLPTLNGVDAQLLAGWAVGGANMAMPDDVRAFRSESPRIRRCVSGARRGWARR